MTRLKTMGEVHHLAAQLAIPLVPARLAAPRPHGIQGLQTNLPPLFVGLANHMEGEEEDWHWGGGARGGGDFFLIFSSALNSMLNAKLSGKKGALFPNMHIQVSTPPPLLSLGSDTPLPSPFCS